MAHPSDASTAERPDLNFFLRLIAVGNPVMACKYAVAWFSQNAGSSFAQAAESQALLAAFSLNSAPAETLLALIGRGADPRARFEEGETVLMLAAASGQTQLVEILMPLCDARATTDNGRLALTLASAEGHLDCAKLLAAAGGFNHQDAFGRTPLIWAAMAGRSDCVEFLLPLADARIADKRGDTALIWAAACGHLDCVRLLAPASDLSHKDRDGNCALARATDQGHASVISFLLPISGPLTQNADGRDALDIALGTARWECADLFAPFIPIERARKIVAGYFPGALPACAAAVERADIQTALDQQKMASGARSETPPPKHSPQRL